MRKKVLSIFILIMLLASACTPKATATPVATTEVPVVTEAPTATAEPVTLTVMAASSLTESFTELGQTFEAANPGVTVAFNFAGSQALSEQLAQGAEADVFASASKKYMTAAVDAKRVNEADVKTFAKNRLIVIYPKDNPAGIATLADLAKAGVKVDLADKAVPVGQYALDFLDKAVEDANYGEAFKTGVLANVVSYEENVKAVVTKVSLGEADAGIVYVTDITADAAEKVGTIAIPDALNTIATYPIAPIADSQNAAMAQKFVDLILSDEGQAVLEKYQFIPAANAFSVTDDSGQTVTLNKAPTRIVLVGKALFMIADAIYMFPGASDKVVAIGSTKQGSGDFVPLIDANYSTKTILSSDAGVEQIAAVNPDLVIMKSASAESLGTPLQQVGIPVVYLNFESLDQYKTDLAVLGQIFQDTAKAEELANWYQGKVDSVTSAVSGLTDDQKPSTLVLYYSDKDGTISFNVPSVSYIQTYMVETAGGKAIWKDDPSLGKGWTTVTLEQIAAWNPDVIFIVSYFVPVGEVVDTIKADANWQALDAVKNDQLYGFPGDAYSWDESDSRWILGLEWVAKTLHPDLFSSLDITAETKAFYLDLYGIDEATYEKDIAPLTFGDIQ